MCQTWKNGDWDFKDVMWCLWRFFHVQNKSFWIAQAICGRQGGCGWWSEVREALHFHNWYQHRKGSAVGLQWPLLNNLRHCQQSWNGQRNGPHHFGWHFGHAEGVCQNGAKALDWEAESSTIECMPRHPSAEGSRQKTLGKRHHRRQVIGFSIWFGNKMTESLVEKCVLTQTKESPHAMFTSESDADHLLWPSGNGASWVCSSRANS